MLSSSLNEKRYEQEARDLCKYVATDWKNYDFSEKEEEIERRVPKIYFSGISDIEVKEMEVERAEGFGYEKFIRRYEVTYKDNHYMFSVEVDSYWNCVKKFWLTVGCAINEHDDAGHLGQVVLFKESL